MALKLTAIKAKRKLSLGKARMRAIIKKARQADDDCNAASLEMFNLTAEISKLQAEISKLQEGVLSWKDAWFRQRNSTGKYGMELHDIVMLIRKWMHKEPHAYSDRVMGLFNYVKRKYMS